MNLDIIFKLLRIFCAVILSSYFFYLMTDYYSQRLIYESNYKLIYVLLLVIITLFLYVLISIFSQGHCLLVGVPGLAKTLLVQTISQSLGLEFSRIQFTPDLMPSDIVGSEILNDKRQFSFIKGPLFANIILADEINRTPPKTQAALLEAMQEKAVTASGITYKLNEPFFVLATQNPIEQEGTYPLPEAQLDRFMFNVVLDYPSYEEELEVIKNTTSNKNIVLKYI